MLNSPERYVEQLFEQLTSQLADQPLSQAGDDHVGVHTVPSADRAKEVLPDVPPDELIADILTELDEWARSG